MAEYITLKLTTKEEKYDDGVEMTLYEDGGVMFIDLSNPYEAMVYLYSDQVKKLLEILKNCKEVAEDEEG
jgi:hypothetical protein